MGLRSQHSGRLAEETKTILATSSELKIAMDASVFRIYINLNRGRLGDELRIGVDAWAAWLKLGMRLALRDLPVGTIVCNSQRLVMDVLVHQHDTQRKMVENVI